MAYSNTSDERYYNGLQYSAGYFDAPDYSANSSYVLAEGLQNAGYGYLEQSYIESDYYDLGTLAPGSYTVVVDGYNWDFSNDVIFTPRPDLNLYKNGLNTFEFDSLGEIDFIVESSANYSVELEGTYSETEYRVYYIYNGSVEGQNNPAIFSNPVYDTSNGLNDNSTILGGLDVYDADGLSNAIFLTYWYLDGVALGYTTNAQIYMTQNEVGGLLTFRVAFQDDLGNLEVSGLYSIGEIANVNDLPEGMVSISGVVGLDEVLTADSSSLNDFDGLGDLSYEWLRDGLSIPGENGESYQLSLDDENSTISVKVSYVDGYGTSEEVTSEGIQVASLLNNLPEGPLLVYGDSIVGNTLLAEPRAISDEDGLGEFSFQWYRNGEIIDGATSDEYSLTNNDAGQLVTASVSYVDGEGYSEMVYGESRLASEPTSDSYTDLIEMYVIILGRAPAQGGLNFWSGLINDGKDFEYVASEMWNSAGAREFYPEDMTTEEVVTSVYVNILVREPKEAGLNYWVERWEENGPVDTMLEMIGALTANNSSDPLAIADKELFQSKVDIGGYLANTVQNTDVDLASSAFDYLETGYSVEETKTFIDTEMGIIGQQEVSSGDDMFA